MHIKSKVGAPGIHLPEIQVVESLASQKIHTQLQDYVTKTVYLKFFNISHNTDDQALNILFL